MISIYITLAYLAGVATPFAVLGYLMSRDED